MTKPTITQVRGKSFEMACAECDEAAWYPNCDRERVIAEVIDTHEHRSTGAAPDRWRLGGWDDG